MTLEELTEAATFEEMRDAIYEAIAASGITTTTWKPGATVRTIVAGLAVVLSAFSQLQAEIAKSGFLELAEGDWLTLVARYVYGVERDPGTFATGVVEVDNASGNIYAGAAGDLIFLNSTNTKTYRNTGAFSIGAGALNVEIPVQAIEIGSESTASPNEIDELVTVLLGVTCSNPEAVVGRDVELDPALRSRCAAKLGTLSPNGPRDAYSFVAKSATRADGTTIGVSRVRVIADGLGGVTVYIADDDGALSAPADVTTVGEAIDELAAPLGIDAETVNASNVVIPVTYEYWLRDDTGKTDGEISSAVASALTAFMARQPIGGHVIPPTAGRVYQSAIEGAIAGAFPEHTIKVVVTTPAADTAIDVDEVPVIGSITVTDIHQVAGGDD